MNEVNNILTNLNIDFNSITEEKSEFSKEYGIKTYNIDDKYIFIIVEDLDRYKESIELFKYVSSNNEFVPKVVYSMNNIIGINKIDGDNFRMSTYKKMTTEEKKSFDKDLVNFINDIHSMNIPEFIKSKEENSAICFNGFNPWALKIKDNKIVGYNSYLNYVISDPDLDFSFVLNRYFKELSNRIMKKYNKEEILNKNMEQFNIDMDDPFYIDLFTNEKEK